MSIRVYRLLRNNKEEGPFTAEELIQKSLRPYDLIWIDGRSGAWNYPGELAEFKKYAPLPNTQTENTRPQPVSASVQAAIAINNLATPAIAQKPRYRVSAAWSKIQTIATPANKTIPVGQPKKTYPKMVEPHQPPEVQSKSLSWEEAWLDWEKEKEIVPDAGNSKTKSLSQKQTNAKESPVLETKYTASLDDLKEQYIEHIVAQKQKSNKNKLPAFILPTVLLIIIFSAAYWLLHNTNATAVLANTTTPVVQPAKPAPAASAIVTNEVEGNNTTAVLPATAINKAAERKPLHNAVQNRETASVKLSGSYADGEVKPVTTQQTTTVSEPVQTSIASDNTAANTTNPVIKKPYDETINTAGDSYTEPEQAVAMKPRVRSTADYVQVPQQIKIIGGDGSLTVKNISGINLDLVVIDVQYFDIANVYRKGETMYLHNLRAGKNTIIKTAKDTNAVYATAKVSLVNADAANISVIGDN